MGDDAEQLPSYRAPMRSRDDSVPAGAGVERALERGLCGVGGRLPVAPADLADAVEATAATYDDRVAARLRRFAEAPDGATVWTRDVDGRYYRGRLDGPWRYDASAAAQQVDLVHVRACAWHEEPVGLVPAAVRETFGRGGRNFQQIRRLAATAPRR